MQRRALLLTLAAGFAGCDTTGELTRAEQPIAASARSFIGGFLAPAIPGALPRTGAGMFVKLQVPTALALRDFDLLVADMATSRLWRVDLMTQTLSAIAGAPVGPETRLLLGPDRSAWVLDRQARQVLRFALDGRLIQTWRGAGPSPVGMAVLDAGARLLVAESTSGQWFELRSGGAVALPVALRRSDGTRQFAVDAMAAGREHMFVLDRAAGLVHRVQRDGEILESLGAGALQQASTLVVDRFDRAWVLDGQGQSLTLLASGKPAVVRSAAELGVQHIGGVAVDHRSLAVSDRLMGLVMIHPLPQPVSALP